MPLLKVIGGRNKVRVKLFSVLPLYKIRQKGNRRVHYLFGALPVWAAGERETAAGAVSDAGAGTVAARGGIPEAAAGREGRAFCRFSHAKPRLYEPQSYSPWRRAIR